MVLSQSLKEMENQGLVVRKQYIEIPPRVEYSLTTAGEDLIPSLESLAKWGKGMQKKNRRINIKKFLKPELFLFLVSPKLALRTYVWYNVIIRTKELIGMRKKKCTMSIPEIMNMYESGSRTEEIAQLANVSARYINSVLQSNNVKRRPRGSG